MSGLISDFLMIVIKNIQLIDLKINWVCLSHPHTFALAFFFWQSVKVGGPQGHTIIRSFCICIFMFANSTSDMFQYDKCIKIRFLMNQGTIITLTWQGLYWGKITKIGQLLPMNKILTVIKLFYHFLFHAGGRG